MYIHIPLYMYVHIPLCMYIHIPIYMYIHIPLYMHIHIPLYMYIHTPLYMYNLKERLGINCLFKYANLFRYVFSNSITQPHSTALHIYAF